MALMVFKNRFLSIGGTDISTYIKSATLTGEYDEVEMDHDGITAHYGIPGLGNWSVEVEVNQDFAAGALDSIIWPLLGAANASAIVMRPTTSVKGADNPEWTGNGRVYGYSPITGATGEGAKVSFTIKCGDGTMISRATS